MKYIFFLFLFLSVFFGNCQDKSKVTIYLDQNLNSINAIDYHEKAISALYFGRQIDQDSIIIKRLLRKYDFGKFNTATLGQVHILLSRELGLQDFEKNIILSYKDSILGYNEFNKSWNARAQLDESTIVSKKEYVSRRSSFDSRQKRCQRIAKRLNTKPFYVYSEKINFEYEPKHYEHHKISKTLQSIFFKYDYHGIVILKPNGQYFFYNYLTQDLLEKMLKDDWKSYITDFKLAKANTQIRVLKFIDDMQKNHRIRSEKLIEKEIQKQQNAIEFSKNRHRTINEPISIKISRCYNFSGF